MCVARRISKAAGGAVAAFAAVALLAPIAAGEDGGEREPLAYNHDVPEEFAMVSNPPGYVLLDLLEAPDGKWSLAHAAVDVGDRLGAGESGFGIVRVDSEDTNQFPAEVLVLLDENDEVALKFGPASHEIDFRIFRAAWLPESRGFVFVGSPTFLDAPHSLAELQEKMRAEEDVAEFDRLLNEYQEIIANYTHHRQKALRTSYLFRVDIPSFQKERLREIDGVVNDIGTDREGNIHFAVGNDVVHVVTPKGELQTSYELPDTPYPTVDGVRGGAQTFRLSAYSKTVWATMAVPAEEDRRGREIWRLRYGTDGGGWERVIDKAQLIDADASDNVLYRSTEGERKYVLHNADTGEHTVLLPEANRLPRAISLTSGDEADVRFRGHRRGLMTLTQLQEAPLSPDRILFEYAVRRP